jgi:hypothetical protein
MVVVTKKGLRRAGAASALCLAAGLVSASPASAQFWGGWGPPPGRTYVEGIGIAQAADILYTRYGMARVLRVRPTSGNVLQADAIDRRGYRVHFVLDGYNGRVLERYFVGQGPYEQAVPMPPGRVPGDPSSAMLPRGNDDGYDEAALPQRLPERAPAPGVGHEFTPGVQIDRRPAERAQPNGQRQARTPDASTAPAHPKAAPARPKSPDKPETAARPAQPEAAPPTRPVAPKPVAPAETALPRPTTTPPAAPPAAAAPAAEPAAPVRQAAPASPTMPEPLIDPKTGEATKGGAVPVAPLDDAKAAPSTPTPIVPPATLE